MSRRFPLILALASLCVLSLAGWSFAADADSPGHPTLNSHDSPASSEPEEASKVDRTSTAFALNLNPATAANGLKKSVKTKQRDDSRSGNRPGNYTLRRHGSVLRISAEEAATHLSKTYDRIGGDWLAATNEPADLKLRAHYSHRALFDPKTADWSVYSFLEGAAPRSGDQSRIDRFGFGGHRRFGRWARFSGELSARDGSLSALAGGSCEINDRIQVYSNTGLDTHPLDDASTGLGGTLTSGTRLRLSEKASIFGEERMQFAEGLNGLTHVFGLHLKTAPDWTWGMGMEMGDMNDSNAEKRRRRGGRLSTGYSRKGVRFASSLEMHLEDGDPPDLALPWDVRNEFEIQMAQGWRFLGSLNASFWAVDIDRAFAGANIECVSELAHKPSDRGGFRMLMKYIFPPDDGDCRSDLQGGLYVSVDDTLKAGVGYKFDHPSSNRSKPSSDPGWFLEIAGSF